MNSTRKTLASFVVAIIVMVGVFGNVQAATTARSALILYDNPAGAAYAKLGKAYAIMLYNLLGHFQMDEVVMQSVNDGYDAGTINNYDVTFYLGSYYGNPLPPALLSEIFATDKTVVWFKYNLWQLAWFDSAAFSAKFGFAYYYTLAPTTAELLQGNFFNSVLYKGKTFEKYWSYDPETNVVAADPDIGYAPIINGSIAQSKADIKNGTTGVVVPYIINGGNFWYVADMPFSYIGPRDRYLVICDILHDILGSTHGEQHYAMIRLEDVSAYANISNVRTIGRYLQRQAIPYSVAVIPVYRDATGKYNGGVEETVKLSEDLAFQNIVNTAMQYGGDIVQHGFTHQYDGMNNPWSQVSGDDFEFWNVVENKPLNDVDLLASQRIGDGFLEFLARGITPFAFEMPHYQGSPLSYAAVGDHYSTRYERAVYYTSDTDDPQLSGGDYAVGQFFPYVIYQDYYGHRVLPENLGNIEYDISDIDPSSYIVYTWQDLLLNAQYALTVRDGFASFFFHPFWLEPELGTPGFTDLKNLVKGISKLKYQWISAKQFSGE